MIHLRIALSVLPLLLLVSCGGAEARDRLAAPIGLKAAKLIESPDNPTTLAKVELGEKLFFDPRLSSTGQMSCATCHPPEQAWADGKQVSAKADGTMNKWNTPTVYNVGYLKELYWDGRSKTLEQNVTAAWKAQLGGDPDAVAKTLAAVPAYRDAFQQAFGGEVTGDRVAQALAAFLRTLRSGESPFDRWQAGDQAAVDNDVKMGWEIFNDRGGCNACHMPPLFTDGVFHNVGIGSKAENPDPGRGKEVPALMGAFKTPTLREVANTAPYFHDGSVATLEEAVRLMANGGIDNPHRDPALKPIADRKITDQEVKYLVAFLRSLSSGLSHPKPKLP